MAKMANKSTNIEATTKSDINRLNATLIPTKADTVCPPSTNNGD